MTKINVNWQELIKSSGGLADSAYEIDSFLQKFGTSDFTKKIELTISNIANYFKQHGIIKAEISASSIEECCKLINEKLIAKEIKTSADFIIAILIALLDKLSSNETNYLTTDQSKEPVDDKIKNIASSFLSKNPPVQVKLVDEFQSLSSQGNNLIKKESIAFMKNLSTIKNLRYV